jgi:hypothetical protein
MCFTVIPQDVVESFVLVRKKKLVDAGFRPKNPMREINNADQALQQHIASAL